MFDQKLTIGGRTTFASIRYGNEWKGGPGQIGYTMAPPGYTIHDLFGSYKFNEDNIVNFSIENIFDAYYFGAMSSLGMPSPGRTARISYTTTFHDEKPLFAGWRRGQCLGGRPAATGPVSDLGGHLVMAWPASTVSRPPPPVWPAESLQPNPPTSSSGT